MELRKYLRLLQDYWRSALATVLVCVAVAAGWTLLQTPTYSASSTVFLTVESGGTAGELSQGATYTERVVKSFVNVGKTSFVLQPVIDLLKLNLTPGQLAGRLTLSSPPSTSIINISAQDSDPNRAAQLSNAVAASLLKAVGELSPPGPTGTRLVSASVVDQAVPPGSPTSPRPALNLALGGLLGALLGLGQALLRSVLDTRLRTTADIQELTDAPILASIGRVGTTADRAVDAEGELWANAEAYRRLRTNVGFVGLGGERRPSIVLTSSLTAEGKTQTVISLARVLAEAGDRVLLIDADLRRPMVAKRMSLDSELGLSDVLTGRGLLRDLTIQVSPNLAVLPAGTVPPNPSELLGSEAMAHLLAGVERQYDYVLFDTPPLLPVTDATVLAAQAGGAIVVARSGKVRRPQFDAALELLKSGNVTLLGVVLNDVTTGRADAYAYYHSAHDQRPALTSPDDPDVEVAHRVKVNALDPA